jgi:hypothetical protein
MFSVSKKILPSMRRIEFRDGEKYLQCHGACKQMKHKDEFTRNPSCPENRAMECKACKRKANAVHVAARKEIREFAAVI